MSIKGAIIFLAGAAVGSVVTAYALKDYYERKTQEEIDSVKESLKTAIKRDISEIDKAEQRKTEEERRVYNEELSKTGYVSENTGILTVYDEDEDEKGVILDENVDHNDASPEPRVISPDEFGEYDDYEQINLTYYSDGILADDNDVKIKDVDAIVGSENLERIGEYEDDALHVRNDRLRADYEILVDYRTYDEILRLNPHLNMED